MMARVAHHVPMDAIAFLIAHDKTRRTVDGASTHGPAPRRRRPADRSARIRG
jgi:hypothetical protein